jgi:hypothetical protein
MHCGFHVFSGKERVVNIYSQESVVWSVLFGVKLLL